jgi:hypothetical protein
VVWKYTSQLKIKIFKSMPSASRDGWPLFCDITGPIAEHYQDCMRGRYYDMLAEEF